MVDTSAFRKTPFNSSSVDDRQLAPSKASLNPSENVQKFAGTQVTAHTKLDLASISGLVARMT